jgi:hypothetical protein
LSATPCRPALLSWPMHQFCPSTPMLHGVARPLPASATPACAGTTLPRHLRALVPPSSTHCTVPPTPLLSRCRIDRKRATMSPLRRPSFLRPFDREATPENPHLDGAVSSTAAAAMSFSGLYMKENGVRTSVDGGERKGDNENSPSREDDESGGPMMTSAAGWHPHCARTYWEKRQ